MESFSMDGGKGGGWLGDPAERVARSKILFRITLRNCKDVDIAQLCENLFALTIVDTITIENRHSVNSIEG